MRFASLRVFVVVAIMGLAKIASAQINGSNVGNVFDQVGMPIKGVKISATSPTQIGGAKVVYTDDEGSFRIVGLQPGVFEVTATATNVTINRSIESDQ